MNYIFDYLVIDERYHLVGMETDIAFRTDDLDEAMLVANEVGFNSVVVRFNPDTEECQLVYDAALSAELPLRP